MVFGEAATDTVSAPVPDWVTAIPSADIHNLPTATPQLTPPFTAAQMQEIVKGFIDAFLKRVVLAVAGSSIPGIPSFDQLADWANNIPGLGDIPGLDELTNWITGGLIPIPVGNVVDAQPNLFTGGTFPAGSIAANPDWSVDTSSRTDDGSGSAMVVADGTPKALRTGTSPTDVIPVVAGQTFTAAVFVSHQGYVGSGVAVELQVVPFTAGARGEPVTLTAPAAPNDPLGDGPAAYSPTAADVAWPGVLLTGSYVVPEGVTGIQGRIYLTAAAQSGVFRFDDATGRQTGKLPQEWVSGLPESFQETLARWQLLVDTQVNGITHGVGSQYSLANLVDALRNQPNSNVSGVNGPANIGSSLLAQLNALIGGMVGVPGSGASNADAYNVSKQVSANAAQGAMSWDVLGIRNNTPVFTGFLPSGHSNFNVTDVAFDATAPTIAATQSASVIGVHRVGVSAPLGVVSWLGYGTTSMTAFYVNLWKIADSGDWGLVHHSPNILADVSGAGTPEWNFYELAEPVATAATELYAVELVPVGGTHHVVGKTTWLPAHPVASASALAFTRNNTAAPDSPPATIAKASLTTSANVPWIETAIDLGSASDVHFPVTRYLNASGTVLIPAWADTVEMVLLGDGGGGKQGLFGQYGQPGQPGKYAAATLLHGIDFDDSDTDIVFVCGPGGQAGGLFTAAEAGTGSTLTLGDFTLTADGGAGASTTSSSAPTGRGPGNYDYNGETYVGGADQNTPGGDGAAPGGAGNGGDNFGVGPGGHGAPGGAWIKFSQTQIVADPTDTTPPTKPVVTVTDTTFSTITVTASGSTD